MLKKTTLYKLTPIIVSIIFSGYIGSLPLLEFKDRSSYLVHISRADLILLENFKDGILTFFANEPLWFCFIATLRNFFTEENVLNIITYLVPFLFSYAILSSNIKLKYFPILIIILLMPLHLANIIMQLRQGLASAIFMLGFFSKNKYLKNRLIIISPFIHATFIVLVPIYYFYQRFDFRKLSLNLRSFVLIIFSAITIFILPTVAMIAGARQFSRYEFDTSSGTGGMFLYWLFLLLLTFLEGRKFQTKHLFEVNGVILFLLMYFLYPIAGRIFNSIMPLVMISFLSMTGKQKFFNISAITFLFIFLWVGKNFSLYWLT
jgi:hypothetical protein